MGVHFTPTISRRTGGDRRAMIIGPGACLTFHREGYKFWQFSLRDLADFATNPGLWRFALQNPGLSIGELYRDLSQAAFLREAQKLVPSLTADMVEPSFAGVMGQVFDSNGRAASDYIFERLAFGGTTLHVRNTPSPACTASLAIAEHIVDIAGQDFKW